MPHQETRSQRPAIPAIYPIHLTEGWAKKLVQEHAAREFREATRFHGQWAEYSYSAQVEENGDVELFVSYRSDDGFCLCSGPCLTVRVRPFSEERLAQFKQDRMFNIAEAEYYRRRREQELAEIARLQETLFGVSA